MSPRLVLCRCDPAWPAMAVCDVCAMRSELGQLEQSMRRRGVVQYDSKSDRRSSSNAERGSAAE